MTQLPLASDEDPAKHNLSCKIPKTSNHTSRYLIPSIKSLYNTVAGIFTSQPIIFKFYIIKLEIVFTRTAPTFDNLFMGCVFNINTVHKTVEKLTFQAFY